MEGEDESFGERYAELLRPIRDLAQNWAIDVAAELEDYMEELELIKVSFDEGQTELNFAEAAMLIQGSTCVYSRKVEFLYVLVFQTLDLIADRKRSAMALEESFGEEVDPREEDAEDELLLLDDLPEARGTAINLVEPHAGAAPTHEETMANLLAETPLALSMKMEQKPGEASFKMLSASVNASGALLLDARDNLVVGDSAEAATVNLAGTIGGAIPMPSPIPSLNASNGRVSFAADIDEARPGEFDFDLDDFDGDDDADQGGDDGEPAPASRQVVQSAAAAAAAVAAKAHKEVEDPWLRLDPHTEYPELDRPFRRGKTSRTPKESTGETELQQPASAPAFLSALAAPSVAALAGSYFKSQFGDFAALESKRRKAQTRSQAKEAAQHAAPAQLAEMQHEEEVRQAEEQADLDAHDGGDFDAGLLDQDDDDLDDIEPIAMEDFGGGQGEADHHDNRLSMVVKSFEELCREHMDQHMLEAEKLSNDAGMAQRVYEWQNSLSPILNEEEERKPFDIHEYGDDLLSRLEEGEHTSEKEPEDFRKIMSKEGDTRFDICRMFLATLQLANNGNVLIAAEDGGAATTALRVSLLNREMHAARVAEYTAPSFAGDAAGAPMPPPAKEPKTKSVAKGKRKGKQKGPALAEVNQPGAEAGTAGRGGVKRKTRTTRSGRAVV